MKNNKNIFDYDNSDFKVKFRNFFKNKLNIDIYGGLFLIDFRKDYNNNDVCVLEID